MNFRITTLILSIISLSSISSASAQFAIKQEAPVSISSVKQAEILTKADNSVQSISFLNESYLKNRNKMIRDSRNYYEATSSLDFSQYAYKYWTDGSENTFNGKLSLNAKHVYKVDDVDVTTTLVAAYAMGLIDSIVWKTEDYFTINSALNIKLHNYINYTLNLNVTSQFANSFANADADAEYPSSRFFSPATVNLGAGFSYKIDNDRNITLSPISGNVVLVLDDSLSMAGLNGVEPGKHSKSSLGSYLNIAWKEPLYKDPESGEVLVFYRTTVASFWNYKRTPSLTWYSWIEATLSKHMTFKLNWTSIFNDQIAKGDDGSFWQFSESMTLGVSYKFTR